MKNNTHFITGGAGFIGSNLVDRLLSNEQKVIAYDNFSTGQHKFLENAKKYPHFTLIEDDILNIKQLANSMNGADIVWHLAANADVRYGLEHPRKDLEQNTIATHNVLEAMRETGINKIVFSSTGSVYGEPEIHPTPEDALFPVQTSLYAASKLAAEGLIQAYCEGFNYTGYIFRFVSVLGERYTHGHVYDFCRKLLENPSLLDVLGNGKQRKSYIYVQDCLDAMLMAVEKCHEKVNIFNLGVNGYTEVNESIHTIINKMNLSPKIVYAGGDRGWIGDSPFIWLDVNKIISLGWKPKIGIQEGVALTLDWLMDNKWVFKSREQ